MRSVLTVTMLATLVARAAAQEITGDIRGRVIADSVVRSGVLVTATGVNLLGRRNAVSARDGVFQILALPPGLYMLRLTAVGFAPVTIDSVRVRLGRSAALGEVVLRRATAELSEVRIIAPAVTLDAARTTVGATLESSDLANLPGDRDHKSLIAILPHANTSYHGDPVNVAGATGLENMYFIDGVNVTAQRDAMRGTSLPYNFVRTVEVRGGGYEARYGKALGAIVNAVTYSGTNDLETSVFGFFTHDGFAASPLAMASLRETGSRSHDAGVRLSGPVMRDRLWFSIAYNSQIERANRTVSTFGSFVDRRKADIFAGKLTWQPNAKLLSELSVFGDPTVHDQVAPNAMAPDYRPLNPEPFLRRLETGGAVGSFRTSWNASPSLDVAAEFAISSGREREFWRAPVGVRSLFIDNVERTLEGGVGLTTEGPQGQRSAALRGDYKTGSHVVRAGIEYEEGRVGRKIGTGTGLIIRNGPSNYVVDSHATDGLLRSRVPVAYLQDSWRASNRLTLNAGVRWSAQYLLGESGVTAQRLSGQWQPRVGFSLDLDDQSRRRIFGSYGRFFQQLPLNQSTLLYVDYTQSNTYYSVDPRQSGATPDSAFDLSVRESDLAHQVSDARADHLDEVTLGFEQIVGAAARLTLRAVRRELHAAFAWGIDSDRQYRLVIGTPGVGELSFLPPVRREYTALEASVEGSRSFLRYRASYVLSRTFGNYTGVYSSDALGAAQVSANLGLFMPHQRVNSTGLLPNDRTHVVKLVTQLDDRSLFGGGMFFTWQSGTPLNEFGIGCCGPLVPAFVSPRGSVGRTPSIWDLNLRLSYRMTREAGAARVVLDLMHLGNPQGVVRIDQQHYQTLDEQGRQATVNPDYRRPTAFLPPMMARLGIELTR